MRNSVQGASRLQIVIAIKTLSMVGNWSGLLSQRMGSFLEGDAAAAFYVHQRQSGMLFFNDAPHTSRRNT